MHEQDHDVIIVGSGIMGAGVAASLRAADRDLRILMVEAGPSVGTTPGIHLHDDPDPEIWERYNQRVATGVQGLYTGAATSSDHPPQRLQDLEAGMHHLGTLHHDAESTPAAAAAWNVGGMGVHWTAATPTPWGTERFDDDDERWDDDLAEARRLLQVRDTAIGPTAIGELVLEGLRRRFRDAPESREPRAMPMAVLPPTDVGQLPRVGPGSIFPPIAGVEDSAFTLLVETLAVAVLHENGAARGVRVRDLRSSRERDLRARAVVICADAHRTPQLLFASGIRPWALGRHLNEHAFLSGRVLLDLERLGLAAEALPLALPGEFATDSLWLPHTGPGQPAHGQIMNSTYVDEDGRPLAHSVGVSLYTPVDPDPGNRILFDEHETDITGMPRMRIVFGYSDADRKRIEDARTLLAQIAADFGDFDPITESALLPPGSSLHQTGTVRSGAVDDGTSVCDPEGRVWSFDNLFVAGNGVVPTALACNSTLTGMITAVRAARAASRILAPLERTR